MSTYTISTLYKKSSEERSFWFKDGQQAIRAEGYRWGTFTKESDEHPDIDLDNDDGYDVYGDGWELVELSDGCWGDWTWPEQMPQDERERLEELWGDEWYEGMEAQGWSQDETEVWLFGPLLLKNEDSGEEWRGDEESGSVAAVLTRDNWLIEDVPAKMANPNLTDWFPVSINPVYTGEYEVSIGVGAISWPFPSYAVWSGSEWTNNSVPVDNVSRWRGLSQDPAA